MNEQALMREALKKKRLEGLDITISVQPPPPVDEEEENDDKAELAPEVNDTVEDNAELAAQDEAATSDLSDEEEMPEASMQDMSDADKMARVEEMTGSATGGGGLSKKVARHWISKLKLGK